ncbi:retrovirus-related pol polyprotein from transposon TNT 1-94, partial [Tanacetum coccineum]
MAEDGKIKIDKFDGHDFGFWKMQIEDYLLLGAVRLHGEDSSLQVVNERLHSCLLKACLYVEKPRHQIRLMLVDINSIMEVQALLLLLWLPRARKDIRRNTSGEYSNSLLSAKDKGKGRKQDIWQKQNRSRSKSKKRGQSKNRQDIVLGLHQKGISESVFKANTIDDRIMDYGASFYATYCKEELERFKLRSGKVRLADDKTLDIVGIKDVVLNTSFGTSWTLKDVRYIPGLKKQLISVGQLDEEGYHVGFGDQQWKVTKGSLVVARGNKRGSLYMVEVPSDGINASIDGRGNAALWHQRLGHMSKKGMKILASKGRIPDLQKVVVGFCKPCVLGKQKKKWKAAVENETNLRVKCLKSDNGGEYSSREFIEYYAENGIRMLKTAIAQMRWDISFGIRRVTRSSEAEMSHLVRTLYMKPRLQQILEIRCDVRGPKAWGSRIWKIDEEDSKDRASSEEEALRLHSYKDPPKSPGLSV